MKLTDLTNFTIETAVHPTGGIVTDLFILDNKKVEAGQQRQLGLMSLVAKGKSEEEATKNGIDFALETIEALKDRADIVRVGTRELAPKEPNSNVFRAKVQVGLFSKFDDNTDLIVKKGYGFGEDKDIKVAQKKAIESALRLMGEK